MESNYNIYKKYPDGMFIWVESVRDAEAGKERLRQLAVRAPGEYKLFCRETHQVVAAENSQAELSP